MTKSKVSDRMDIDNSCKEKREIIPPHKLPFLESICWQMANVYQLTPEEMLSTYERGWRYHHIFNNLEGEELNFLKEIASKYRSWLVVELCNLE
ncbi:hypothetical protein [Calothrix sp. NIES-3974]|uniref:hypothetical protein n=1 Tax=Calothrix sp. NIES-3974 TaxID=2005462 RepID=UPI000B5F9C36|nr:hypothetical protein [Calothrix sp. NIES-3974]BAZ06528.1 hypothetical protein NIES3974_31890 [Calothrix sp. NIES-3974]